MSDLAETLYWISVSTPVSELVYTLPPDSWEELSETERGYWERFAFALLEGRLLVNLDALPGATDE